MLLPKKRLKGNKFIAVTYMGVCNVYQLFSEILPMSGNTENEIKDKLINVYNELQTGKEKCRFIKYKSHEA